MSLLYDGHPQFKKSRPSFRVESPTPGQVCRKSEPDPGLGHPLDLPDLWCRVMNLLQFDWCMWHGMWTRKSRMDSRMDGYCTNCAENLRWYRVLQKAGLK